jgi:formylglycine-generating enzyme required for sulfatase activity
MNKAECSLKKMGLSYKRVPLHRSGVKLAVGLLILELLLSACSPGATSASGVAVSGIDATQTYQAQLKVIVDQKHAELTAAALTNAPTVTPTLTPTLTMTITLTPTITSTPTKQPPKNATRISPLDQMVQVYIPAGTFLQGSKLNPNFPPNSENPQRKVYLDGFWIDKTLVTNRMYRSCMAANQCKPPINNDTENQNFTAGGALDLPAIYVNWYDAQIYCTWVGGSLPTEAQWEKAARGSKDDRKYPWGDQDPNPSMLNFNNLLGITTISGSYPTGASPYGVLDMAGNVRQWVFDWYQSDYYSVAPDRNPPGPATGTKKVLKGGGWTDPANYVRISSRLDHLPDSAGYNRGFRCAHP